MGVRILAQAATLLVVARMLGPTDYGAFAGIAALAVLLGTLSAFGNQIVLVAEVSRDGSRRDGVLAFALPTTLVCGSVLLAVYIGVALVLLRGAAIDRLAVVALGVAEVLIQPLIGLASAEHQGRDRIAMSQTVATLPLALRAIAAVAVWQLRPENPLLDFTLGYLGASVLGLMLALRTLPQPWPAFDRWRLARRHELAEAAGFAAISVTAIGPTELDKTLALRLLSLGEAGVFAAGTRVIIASMVPIVAMMQAATPRLFRSAAHDASSTNILLRQLGWFALGYAVLVGGGLYAAAPIVQWVFGASYFHLDDAVRWLTPVIPGIALRTVASNALVSLGKPWMRVSFEIFGLLVLVAAASTLAPHLGIKGMVVALASAEWSMAILGVLQIVSVRRRQLPR